MSGVKTAISVDEDLFEKINTLAHELHVSRSRLFAMAMHDYLKKQENQALLAKLNDAYSDQPNAEEQKISASTKHKHRKIIEQEPW